MKINRYTTRETNWWKVVGVLSWTHSKTASEDALSLSYTWNSHKRERQNTLRVVFSNALHMICRLGSRESNVGMTNARLWVQFRFQQWEHAVKAPSVDVEKARSVFMKILMSSNWRLNIPLPNWNISIPPSPGAVIPAELNFRRIQIKPDVVLNY